MYEAQYMSPGEKDYTMAMNLFKEATLLNGVHPAAYFALATTYKAKGDPLLAAGTACKAMKLSTPASGPWADAIEFAYTVLKAPHAVRRPHGGG